MSYITVQQIRERFEQARRQSNVRTFSASTVLNEGRQISDSTKTFDIIIQVIAYAGTTFCTFYNDYILIIPYSL